MHILRLLTMVVVTYTLSSSLSSVLNSFFAPLAPIKQIGKSHSQILSKSGSVIQVLYIVFVIALENGNQK